MKTRYFSYLLYMTVLLSGMTGCSMVDQKVILNYAPVDRAFGLQKGNIAITRMEPRQARNSAGDWIIGAMNNVHGVRQANLLSNRSLGDWVSDAILLELKHTGYSTALVTSFPSGTVHGIRISDINAFMNVTRENVTSKTSQELKFNVDLYLNGVKTKTFTVASRDNQTVPLTVSQEKLEQIMLKSLQDAMQQLMPEIIAFTKK